MINFLSFFGITIENISKEEAAFTLMEREVKFAWRPQIVELKQ